jgi:hypothetical protein
MGLFVELFMELFVELAKATAKNRLLESLPHDLKTKSLQAARFSAHTQARPLRLPKRARHTKSKITKLNE